MYPECVSSTEGQLVGTFGDFACGSLYANKIVTSGDGGWVMARDERHLARLKSLANHGFDPQFHFRHFEVALNAKINGVGAALAAGGFEKLEELLERKEERVREGRTDE